MKIKFFFLEKVPSLKERIQLKTFIVSIFSKERKKLDSLSYIFCSDDYLLEINKSYLNHDYYTDIITFCLSEPSFPIQGDIYISIDRIRDNAKSHSTSFKQEIHRVVFHGALHLCGYKDKTSADQKIMRSKEDHYLKSYFK